MTKYSTKIKRNLFHIIKEMSCNPQNFVHHPEKDLTRVRQFSFESLLKFILAMNGKSLYKELMDYFDDDLKTPSHSTTK